MNQDRWEKIEEIYHRASQIENEEERSFFLNNACGADLNLRREVDSLLAENCVGDDFLSHPQLSLGLSVLAGEQNHTLVGESVGHYKIIKQIGRGGMGVVYLAHDLRLSRDVALKVLSPHIINDNIIDRFKREARAASAISHPNVAHIYEIGEHGEKLFIAMEFVEGGTLRDLTRTTPLNLGQAVEVALQTASALAAAHDKEIVHRDIKPENIIIRPDGLVKVVDFGLAKSTAINPSPAHNNQSADNPFAPNPAVSEPGLIMGTVNYMSPEQVRGLNTDSRTDVWSMGVVFYELVEWALPFRGETASDVIASILRNEPPPLPPGTPVELNSIIAKALQKNPDDRYRNAHDLLIDLRKLEHSSSVSRLNSNYLGPFATNENRPANSTDGNQERGSLSTGESRISTIVETRRPVRRAKDRYVLVAICLGLIALATAATKFSFPQLTAWWSSKTDSLQKMHLRKLTATGKIADGIAAISPDGRYVAYVVEEGSLRSLWLKQTWTSATLEIVLPAEVHYYSLNFSRDGDQLYYSVSTDNRSVELYQIPSLGGNARKLSDDVGDGRVTFSPGGDRFAFVRAARTLMIADLQSAEARAVATAPEEVVWIIPTWSPDGKAIILAASTPADGFFRLNEIAVDDGMNKDLAGPSWYRISGIAWLSDASGLIVSGRDPETRLAQLWTRDHPAGTVRRITNDLNAYIGAGVSADGQNLVSVQQERVSNIHIAPNGDPGSLQKITVERGTDDGMSGIALTSNNRIIYTSHQNGSRDLWIVNRDGSESRQLTFNLQYSVFPTVSPDDRFVAFVTDISGTPKIWRLDLNDGGLKQITSGPGVSAYPSFSPDGNWIFYQHTENNTSTIWKIGKDGEDPIRVTNQGDSSRPALSPDGKFIACVYEETPDSPARVAIFPAAGARDPIKLIDSGAIVNTYNFSWSTDGDSLIYVDGRNGTYNLWSQALQGGKAKQITNFTSGQIYRFARSRDGKGFVLALSHESSDIIQISNFN